MAKFQVQKCNRHCKPTIHNQALSLTMAIRQESGLFSLSSLLRKRDWQRTFSPILAEFDGPSYASCWLHERLTGYDAAGLSHSIKGLPTNFNTAKLRSNNNWQQTQHRSLQFVVPLDQQLPCLLCANQKLLKSQACTSLWPALDHLFSKAFALDLKTWKAEKSSTQTSGCMCQIYQMYCSGGHNNSAQEA